MTFLAMTLWTTFSSEAPVSNSEYDENLYTAGLPPILGLTDTAEQLKHQPRFAESEKTCPPAERRYMPLKLKRYFRATKRHVVFAEQFGMLLREGYMGRDPSQHRQDARIIEVADQARAGSLLSAKSTLGFANSATSAMLIGMPGMGKTFTIDRILATYTQVIKHDDLPAQIVWLKIETPPRGSIRALCVNFFHEVDSALSQTVYTELYAGSNASEDMMMIHMALVANRHALGCLVIDEIQHLPRGGDEVPAIMTFLVTLTNKMGVPVLFIGTKSAASLFETSARLGRRSVGIACGIWDNYGANDKEWANFLTDLWKYQWTSSTTPLDDSMRATFHDLTQGVVDLAIKLFMLVQMRLTVRTESNDPRPELIDIAAVREVWDRDFIPVHDFVDALRSKDPVKLARFEDLAPFNAQFARMVQQLAAPSNTVQLTAQNLDFAEWEPPTEEPKATPSDIAEQAVFAELAGRGLDDDLIISVIAEAKADIGDPAGRLTAFLGHIEKLLAPDRIKRTPPKTKPIENLVEGDLRQLARDAAGSGLKVCEAFEQAGVGGLHALQLAA